MEITEKVAYLKGLAEGLGLDTETKEGKILSAMIDILDDIALEMEDMKDDQQELGDGLDVISDDLEDVENFVYGEDEECDEECEDCYTTTCPNCGEDIYFDESILEEGEVLCPNCGEKLEFDTEIVEDDETGDPDCSGESDPE